MVKLAQRFQASTVQPGKIEVRFKAQLGKV